MDFSKDIELFCFTFYIIYFIIKIISLLYTFMGISEAKVSSKFQITIPAWVREKLAITAHCEVVWIEMNPGDVTLVSKNKSPKNIDWVDQLCGIVEDKSFDSMKELKRYKKEDQIMEKRGIF